jgi:hypothetical protein
MEPALEERGDLAKLTASLCPSGPQWSPLLRAG